MRMMQFLSFDTASANNSRSRLAALRQEIWHLGVRLRAAKRFYGLGQAFCKSFRIKFGFVSVHRPCSSGDAPSQNDETRSS